MIEAEPTETEFVRNAQRGDAGALGILLSRHEAKMRAVALSILGYGPDADDAVQDAMLLALAHIGKVRDPASVGPWLHTIVRNACRKRQRATRPVFLGDEQWKLLPADAVDPQKAVEDTALRDWVWHAVTELSERDRLVTLLRYFSGVTAYEQIAALCGIPVGTVRSRLSHARQALADRLRSTANAAHPDATAAMESRRRAAQSMLTTAMEGNFRKVVEDLWLPQAEIATAGTVRGGREYAVRAMDADLSAGVRQRLRNVVGGGDVLIWETDLINPPENPSHCPPGVVWMHALDGGRVRRLTLFHPVPPAR